MQDSELTASKAEKLFHEKLKELKIWIPTAEPVLYKYVLCKHTLSELAKAISSKKISMTRELKRTLIVALYACYLVSSGSKRVPEKITRIVVRILRVRGWR